MAIYSDYWRRWAEGEDDGEGASTDVSSLWGGGKLRSQEDAVMVSR